MKKIVPLLLLCASLAGEIGTHVRVAAAQSKATPKDLWMTFNQTERRLWVKGFREGAMIARDTAKPWPAAAKAIEKEIALGANLQSQQLEGVMSALYADPANAKIPWYGMIVLAAESIGGEDIEPQLRSARRASAPD